jgi:hypothetical protein
MDEKTLNFQLAYKRVQDELLDQPRSGRAFVANTFERDLVELDLVVCLGFSW